MAPPIPGGVLRTTEQRRGVARVGGLDYGRLVVNGLVEIVVPVRLGRGFRWLLASSWSSNFGDGLMTAAGPLLVASRTHDPVLVAAAALASQLPWLLFGLVAGALADRLHRRGDRFGGGSPSGGGVG